MYWIDRFKLAEIYRETYVAILKSWVPHGKRDEFARKCGITREYYSCLCVLGTPSERRKLKHKRLPSPEVARRIAKNLPAPEKVRRSLLENMELAHLNVAEIHHTPGRIRDPKLLKERLDELSKVHRQATFGRDLTEVNRSYQVVRDASFQLLPQISVENNPDSFAQACLYYHDAQCVLNRPEEALRYAKIAQLVLESSDQIEFGYSIEQRNDLEMNTIRGEAVAYHNLKEDRLVPDILLNRACRTSAYRNSVSFWKPIVMRDLINSLVEIPRFSIREVNQIAAEIEKICEKKEDEFTLLLVREAWLRSLVRRDKFVTARLMFDEEMRRLPHLRTVGALHKALLLKSGADLSWKLNDLDAWRSRIFDAVSLMREAGLWHQLNLIRQEYGPTAEQVLGGPGSPSG